jgi:hypothetical protein
LFASLLQVFDYLGRHIAGPSLAGIETDDPDGIAVLAAQEIPYDGFVIRGLYVDFAPNAAEPAEIIDDQIDARLAARNDRRGPTTTNVTPSGFGAQAVIGIALNENKSVHDYARMAGVGGGPMSRRISGSISCWAPSPL